MLQDDTRIQLDLADALNINKILLDSAPLHYERDSGAVFVDFPYTFTQRFRLHDRLLVRWVP